MIDRKSFMLKEIVLFAVAKRLQSYFCDYLIPLTVKSYIKKLPKVNFLDLRKFFLFPILFENCPTLISKFRICFSFFIGH